jgi:molecular chaperone HscC
MSMIGIDLGTTNSLAAIWRNGAVELIPNALGEVLTPSAVFMGTDNTLLVGRAARDRWLLQPERGVLTFKRHMGTDRRMQLGAQAYRPEELSALVLRQLKDDAERHLGHAVTEAVITVPAYFSDAQRQATRLAGELAGLTVRRLVNEPTAAALAYGLQEAPPESTYMVLDLGGGTFDVSILERFEGVMEVRASAGDNRLGGEDFVHAMCMALAQQWPTLPPLEANPELQARMWREAERSKRALSSHGMDTFTLEWAGVTHRSDVSTDLFAQWCEPLLARLRHPIERALRDANLRPADLDQVVLAGGATRMPMVRQMVARMFGRMPAMNLNPDEVVARGAAVMAGLLQRDEALEEMVMTDVCPYTLGTSISRKLADGGHLSGLYAPIIERNTPVPVSREETYVTGTDGQTQVHVDVYQGESLKVADNVMLGELLVRVPAKPAGQERVNVRFTYDASGILEVQVTVPSTGEVKQLVLQRGAQVLPEAEVAERLKALAALKVHPRDQQANQAVLARAQRLHDDLLGADRREFAEWVIRFEAALLAQEPSRIDQARTQLTSAIEAFSGTSLF